MASLGAHAARRVVDLWADRTAALLARPEVRYVLVFENRGREVGATIDHPHGQIYAFGFVPPTPHKELEVARAQTCPVCAMGREERAGGERVVVREEGWLGWVPFASPWPYGLLLAPEPHVDGLPGLDDELREGFARALVDALARYDRLFARPFPYMLWIHQLPGDEHAHLHVHVAPPLRAAHTMRYVAAGELGSGVFFNPIRPETAAAALRDA
jgi:UDPglucose--hexose-1-phosphate uridylyltransferase